MKNLNCIIADDEPIARQILENYIVSIPYLTLVAPCKNAFEVLEKLQEQEVDILFLDINMPKLSGLSLLKTLQKKPNVIITTAYPEYAIEGFELSVTDYLVKPFSLERFMQAVQKVSRNKVSETIVINQQEQTAKSIFIKSDKKILKINFDEIYYAEAYGNYVKIFTDKMILTPQTLSDFLQKLSSNFIRIHKSYLINFNYLKMIDGNQIILQNEAKLPIGKSYKKELLERIDNR
ncbi:response regulator transcription factor [Polaribacter batillariae]|uniref:Response regulator transcription factor n=1 Tax=Polaribacter batillariae TaxID=2808900 RepID=A0ABX7T001_9FLAO|nr:LytTR family DNA-binding domain-containing protein [Polaribacter batillariae]QTD39083.1 response regulator transcription factor [Polaribacter batillariae]